MNLELMKLYCDYPLPGQLGYQDPGSLGILGVFELHDRIIFYLIILFVIVMWFFVQSLLISSKLPLSFAHGNQIEFIWTLFPAAIQWGIGLPSLKLLYLMDEILDSDLTIKAIGNQWYFSSAINKSQSLGQRNFNNLNPFWVTGFSDAESCFSVNMQIFSNGNRSISTTFKISLDIKDINILYDLKNYFKIGQITIHKNEARFEIMGHENAILHIIPHFDKYPQISQKKADYLLWKDILLLQHKKEHLTLEGFIKCLSLKFYLNNGLSDKLKNLFPNIIPVPRPITALTQAIDPHWLSGFTAGEGSFMIIINKSQTCKTGYQIQAKFSIGQHIRDIQLLNLIKDFQGCGKIYTYKKDGKIVIENFGNLVKLLPHFYKYPLMNRKGSEFILWCKVVEMIKNKEHLTISGLAAIRSIRNNIRKDRQN